MHAERGCVLCMRQCRSGCSRYHTYIKNNLTFSVCFYTISDASGIGLGGVSNLCSVQNNVFVSLPRCKNWSTCSSSSSPCCSCSGCSCSWSSPCSCACCPCCSCSSPCSSSCCSFILLFLCLLLLFLFFLFSLFFSCFLFFWICLFFLLSLFHFFCTCPCSFVPSGRKPVYM